MTCDVIVVTSSSLCSQILEKTHRTAMEDKDQLINNLQSIVNENEQKIEELEQALSGSREKMKLTTQV